MAGGSRDAGHGKGETGMPGIPSARASYWDRPPDIRAVGGIRLASPRSLPALAARRGLILAVTGLGTGNDRPVSSDTRECIPYPFPSLPGLDLHRAI